ncbi:hypothetical protein DIQ79_15250 [Mycolicibacterium smegmatis]|uniref:Uncharacterized protein n=1 Tax=Mycolicibacterium smegmatis (strain ATCC 700084 / mc(2)155) TaxID=246196 RepID=A0QXG4_MYCS2|nr:hypothetical protein MSMEG_3291 [Mycolicibacterium smegmatis MC2 155]TBM38405.1 hypothetical protein DIQ86_29020 [Mycolicibacterium smegmatis]TBH44818.1 hypothetical protein EYS45_14835 [Mycolicibacterium smegmatis MC2 155]TBM50092.1 hypothetical protein DIQ85_16220 [Mycolicibacterium smegmatis]TBM61092.1 hypothetical protein DIQ83_16280 [Mycolicibacterium smegmatis]
MCLFEVGLDAVHSPGAAAGALPECRTALRPVTLFSFGHRGCDVNHAPPARVVPDDWI